MTQQPSPLPEIDSTQTIQLSEDKFYQISIYPARMLLRYLTNRHWRNGAEITATFHVFQEVNRRMERHEVISERLQQWVVGMDQIESFRIFIPENESIYHAMLKIGAAAEPTWNSWIYTLEGKQWKWDGNDLKAVKNRGHGAIATFIPHETEKTAP